jgi:Scavenger receptor cysteine-rich domain
MMSLSYKCGLSSILCDNFVVPTLPLVLAPASLCCAEAKKKVRIVSEAPKPNRTIGRLELLYGVGWGAVCRGTGNDVLERGVAAVACKQLGFDDGAFAAKTTAPGPAPASVVRFQLVANCVGTEKALEKCKGFAIKPVPYAYGPDALKTCGGDVMLNCVTR